MDNNNDDKLLVSIVIWICKAVFFGTLFYAGVTHDWGIGIALFIGHFTGKGIANAERDPKSISK